MDIFNQLYFNGFVCDISTFPINRELRQSPNDNEKLLKENGNA
jgi:hypothetical protein